MGTFYLYIYMLVTSIHPSYNYIPLLLHLLPYTMESKQAHHNYGMISLDLRLRIGREEEAPYACSYC
jgi:hypothetical protein